MKVLISILIVIGVIFTAWRVFDYYQKVQAEEAAEQANRGLDLSPRSLPGLPRELERPLAEVTRRGPEALKEWLDHANANQWIEDPRRAWIELDYVLMVMREDPVEAKRVYFQVRDRISEDSPVYPRVESMRKTFE